MKLEKMVLLSVFVACLMVGIAACSGSPAQLPGDSTSHASSNPGSNSNPPSGVDAGTPGQGDGGGQQAQPDSGPFCNEVCQYNQCHAQACAPVTEPFDPTTGRASATYVACGQMANMCGQAAIDCGQCTADDLCGDRYPNQCSHICRAGAKGSLTDPLSVCANEKPGDPTTDPNGIQKTIWQTPADCQHAWRYGIYGNVDWQGNREDPGAKYEIDADYRDHVVQSGTQRVWCRLATSVKMVEQQ